jgi:hypothetical protein
MQKIKSAALALPALLLAGCAAALPAENTATIETAAAAAPQTLKVYTSASLAPAAQAYAEAQGVALTLTDEAASADLLLTDHAPGGSLLDVTSDTLLAAAAARAGITENANALPLGRSLYGYWARADVLNAMLGDGAAAALQTANWEEWSDFVETLSAWMAEPKAATVTLSGADYTLPDARPGSLTATGVFAAPLDRASGYTAALLAADGTYTADALTGPLNGVYSAVTLEWDHMAADGGEGIFRRAKLTDLLAEYGADTCNGLVLVPFKCQLDDSDLTAEDYNAEGLLNYPVLALRATSPVPGESVPRGKAWGRLTPPPPARPMHHPQRRCARPWCAFRCPAGSTRWQSGHRRLQCPAPRRAGCPCRPAAPAWP